jgi:hypothetical protein
VEFVGERGEDVLDNVPVLECIIDGVVIALLVNEKYSRYIDIC